MRTSLWLTSAFIALVAVGCDDDGNVADSTDDMGNVGEHDGAGGSRVDGDVPETAAHPVVLFARAYGIAV